MVKVIDKADAAPALVAAQNEFITSMVATAARSGVATFGVAPCSTLVALIGKSTDFLMIYDLEATADYLQAMADGLRGHDTDAARLQSFQRIADAADLTHRSATGTA